MEFKINRSFLTIVALIVIQIVANLLFYAFYPRAIHLDLILRVSLINILYIAICMFLVYRLSRGYLRELLTQSHMNRVLYNLYQKSAQHNSTEELYQDILHAAVDSVPAANKGCIMLLDDNGQTLRFVAVEGYDASILKNTFLDLEESYLFRESKGQIEKSVVIHDPFGYDRKNITSKNMENILSAGDNDAMSTISTPIIYEGKLYGMINVDSPVKHAYKQSDIDNIEIFSYEVNNVIRLYLSLKENTFISTHDQLTGIANRSFFNKALHSMLEPGQCEKFTLVSMDLNHLKGTNDSYGHLVGDDLLIRFTEGFSQFIPPNSNFARYGGDEFLLLLPDVTHKEVIDLLLKVKKWFGAHPMLVETVPIHIDFSYGIVHYPDDTADFDGILQLADNRMYEQKRYHHELYKN